MIKINNNNFNNFNSNDNNGYYNNFNYNNYYQYRNNQYNNIDYNYFEECNKEYEKINKKIFKKRIISSTILVLITSVLIINNIKDKSKIEIESNEISVASASFDLKDNELEPKLPEYKSIDNNTLYKNSRLIIETEENVNNVLKDNISNEKNKIKEKEKTKKTVVSSMPKKQNGSFASFSGNKTYSLSSKERSLLERLLAAEARGEDYKGQLAVASVIANRVESSLFPNTIEGVIYQKGQYSPVSNGKINTVIPNNTQKKVISEVFDKGIRNVPRDVVYFCYPEISSSKWMINNKKQYGRHGCHAFFYK